jgi:hypothetical protein
MSAFCLAVHRKGSITCFGHEDMAAAVAAMKALPDDPEVIDVKVIDMATGEEAKSAPAKSDAPAASGNMAVGKTPAPGDKS